MSFRHTLTYVHIIIIHNKKIISAKIHILKFKDNNYKCIIQKYELFNKVRYVNVLLDHYLLNN